MKANILPDKIKHYPVLLKEILSIISPKQGDTFIDFTFGQGGYTKKILEHPKTKVIALDRDIESFKEAEITKNKFKERFTFSNIKFSQINNLKLKNEDINGAIFDLGYSYTQIKDPKKGLSFDFTGDLNMKMGINDFSAREVVNHLNEEELAKIFKYFGDERESKRIAFNIIKNRKNKNLNTEDLVKIINSSKRKKNYKIHNATKVFQALRIFVNKEISELIYGLINATKIIEKDGIIAVVTFHSLEDKIVKYFFKNLSENKSVSRYVPKITEKVNLLKLINKKPILPSKEEIKQNPPSRSAKLRCASKLENFYDFKTDILSKFKYLIDIENFSSKL
jgi:16S rRNA (cytosine1402-N4)-methyltransferase